MPSGNNGPVRPGGIRRAIIIMILVIAGLVGFFAWNYQVNMQNAGQDSGTAVASYEIDGSLWTTG
ncbi:MAG: tetratricopeptide repeat protein [Ruaniaceae bacterium]|nr:tetratricopeptide repeat protein [Ruaniaceae bacterium]